MTKAFDKALDAVSKLDPQDNEPPGDKTHAEVLQSLIAACNSAMVQVLDHGSMQLGTPAYRSFYRAVFHAKSALSRIEAEDAAPI